MLQEILSSIRAFPERLALKIAGDEYTYDDLGRRVSAIAHELNRFDPHEKLVGVWASDSLDTYSAILAILFSGRGYVPLLPQSPARKNEYIIAESGIRSLLIPGSDSSDVYLSGRPENRINTGTLGEPEYALSVEQAGPERVAYLLFTSGSTGSPKGVPISRGNLDAFIKAFNRVGPALDETDRCLQMFDLTFDFSVASVFTPLVKGASLFTLPQKSIRYNHILRLLLRENLSVLPMVPSLLNHLAGYYEELELNGVKYCYFCGEALPVNTLQSLVQYIPQARFVNFYGPTEATVFSTAYEWNPKSGENKSHKGVVSIGRPLPGMQCRIYLDRPEKDYKAGTRGELLLSGPQVTPGYWLDPQLNEERFVKVGDQASGETWYRTGDLVFSDREGDFFYVGRMDHQVQIQGFRVELEEIEYHAMQFPGLSQACAVAHESDLESLKIHLFIQGDTVDPDKLRTFLKSRLPSYMIPPDMSVLDHIPLNANGKVDRVRLASLAGKS